MQNSFNISCQTKELKYIRKFTNNFLSSSEINNSTKNQIILAIDEICANLIIHASNKDSNKKIEIILELDPNKQELNIRILDDGLHFDYSNYKEPFIEDIISSKQKGGIGLFLVRKIMDKVEFLKDGGKNITLRNAKISL